MNQPLHTAHLDRDALEARFAASVCARLGAGSASLPHDLTERLRHARERALERARTARSAGAAPARSAGGGGWWWRLASAAPGVLLVVGLVTIQSLHDDEQSQVAADIDAALLSDDLPPLAYTDPGFAEFLKAPGS